MPERARQEQVEGGSFRNADADGRNIRIGDTADAGVLRDEIGRVRFQIRRAEIKNSLPIVLGHERGKVPFVGIGGANEIAHRRIGAGFERHSETGCELLADLNGDAAQTCGCRIFQYVERARHRKGDAQCAARNQFRARGR